MAGSVCKNVCLNPLQWQKEAFRTGNVTNTAELKISYTMRLNSERVFCYAGTADADLQGSGHPAVYRSRNLQPIHHAACQNVHIRPSDSPHSHIRRSKTD